MADIVDHQPTADAIAINGVVLGKGAGYAGSGRKDAGGIGTLCFNAEAERAQSCAEGRNGGLVEGDFPLVRGSLSI